MLQVEISLTKIFASKFPVNVESNASSHGLVSWRLNLNGRAKSLQTAGLTETNASGHEFSDDEFVS